MSATVDPTRLVLDPFTALARYRHELTLQLSDGRPVVLPGVIGTVFFERGGQPDVRQGILDCFDEFERLFGQHLKGGKDADLGKFTKRTPKGLEKIRSALVEAPPEYGVSVVRSSATDQDTAAEYQIQTLTQQVMPMDDLSPVNGEVLIAKGTNTGLSYLSFAVPMDLVVDDEGLALYEGFLRYVCAKLPVRGGYGGLSPLLPYSFHRYMPQEWMLASKFSGLEIDSYAHIEGDTYECFTYDGASLQQLEAIYRYPKPGAKVGKWCFIKGVNWYTLLGEPFVQILGGETALRAALDRPDIGIDRVGQCVLIRAGKFPRLGAPEEGLPDPYVFVNSVLRVLRNPARAPLHTRIPDLPSADKENTRLWQARFDLPDAPPIPAPPTVVPLPPDVLRRRQSVQGGQPCPESGWWFTLATDKPARFFKAGAMMPIIQGSSYGATFWQWTDKKA